MIGSAKLDDEARAKLNEMHRTANFINRIIEMLVEKKVANADKPYRVAVVNDLIDKAAQQLEQLEYSMQELLGWEKDKNKHTWWMRNTYCSCPWCDNTDPMHFGTGKIISEDCPIHGIRPDGK